LGTRGIRIALHASNSFHSYLAAGLIAYLVAQSVLIIGGNLRLFPLTGVTLPLVSYGGTSLLTSWIAILFLLHISNRSAEQPQAFLRYPHPYQGLAALLLTGLAGAALILGWWSFYRGPDLLTRTDNPRRAIADRVVPRGNILARDNEPITVTRGEPGDFFRQYLYPPLSPIIGYTNPIYGQSGLEASLDPYLRGLQGYPGFTAWWNHLLYGQPPAGLDVRLTLDMALQRTADQALGDHSGAMILIDAKTGEILAMSSYPGFDANQLEQLWNQIISDPGAPLLNRVTMGSYPGKNLVDELLPNFYSKEVLDFDPQIRIPTGGKPSSGSDEYSPLQMVLVGAALSNGGIRPAPNLVQSVRIPQADWVILPILQNAEQIFTSKETLATVSSREISELRLWQIVSVARGDPDKSVTWYLGGTLPGQVGRSLVLAVLLEEDNPEAVTKIGQSVLQAAIRK